MIERANQVLEQLPPGKVLDSVFNFPRASQLEISFRIKPISFTFTGPVEGLVLTYGIGNPPDFGLGQLQSEVLKLPQQFAGRAVYEKELATLKDNIVSLEAGVAAAISQRSNLVGVRELVEKDEPSNYSALFQARAAEQLAYAEVTEKEIQLSEARAALTQAELENNEGWTPLVTATITRDFDALRVKTQTTGTPQFTLEYTLVVSRPEDIGATYVSPANFGQGR